MVGSFAHLSPFCCAMSVGFASFGGWNRAIMSFFSSCPDFFWCFVGTEVPLPFGCWSFARPVGCVAAAVAAGVGGERLVLQEGAAGVKGVVLQRVRVLLCGDEPVCRAHGWRDGRERIELAGGG